MLLTLQNDVYVFGQNCENKTFKFDVFFCGSNIDALQWVWIFGSLIAILFHFIHSASQVQVNWFFCLFFGPILQM